HMDGGFLFEVSPDRSPRTVCAGAASLMRRNAFERDGFYDAAVSSFAGIFRNAESRGQVGNPSADRICVSDGCDVRLSMDCGGWNGGLRGPGWKSCRIQCGIQNNRRSVFASAFPIVAWVQLVWALCQPSRRYRLVDRRGDDSSRLLL